MLKFFKASRNLRAIERYMQENHPRAIPGGAIDERVIHTLDDLEFRLHKAEAEIMRLKQKYEPHKVQASRVEVVKVQDIVRGEATGVVGAGVREVQPVQEEFKQANS